MPECLNRKAINRNLLEQYKYPSGSWGAIETNMATIYFYWFIFSFILEHNYTWNDDHITGVLFQIHKKESRLSIKIQWCAGFEKCVIWQIKLKKVKIKHDYSKKNHHSKRLQKSTVKKEWVKVIRDINTTKYSYYKVHNSIHRVSFNHIKPSNNLLTILYWKKIHQTYLCIQNLCWYNCFEDK